MVTFVAVLGFFLSSFAVFLILCVVLTLLFTVLLNVWCGVPFVPTPQVIVRSMVELARLKTGDHVYDLGAGDARLLVTAKKKEKTIVAIGYELAPLALLLAKLRMFFSGQRIEMRMKNFLADDVSDADVVFLYLSPEYMMKLAPKFNRELKKGTKVISHAFTFKDREPKEVGLVHHRFSRRPTKTYLYIW